MFENLNFRSNVLFGSDDDAREAAIKRAWDGFRATKEKILAPTWEDRVFPSERFGQNTRIFWDETDQTGMIQLPNANTPVRFTRESPFLAQLLAHYQIDKRLIDRLLDTRNPKHREVMEFLTMSLMLEPFKEVKEGAGRMVRMIDESDIAPKEAMAFLSSNYLRLDHPPYFEALESWAISMNLTPMRTWAKGGDVGVSFVQARRLEPNGIRRGELVAFGISTKNSMTGGASFKVDSYGLVIHCSNGMMGTDFLGSFTRRHIGRRIGASDDAVLYTKEEQESVSTILNRAHSLVEDAMNPEHQKEVQDAIRTTADMSLEDRLDGFRRARAAFIENAKAPIRAAQELQHHLGMSTGEAIGTLNRWFEEPAGRPVEESIDQIPTAWGLVQATTRTGRDLAQDKPDRATDLESVGGSMLKMFRDSRKDFERITKDVLHAATK